MWHCPRLDRTVAIKILPTHLADNAEARQDCDREARAISSLNHPNVCTMHDVGHQDGIDFLVSRTGRQSCRRDNPFRCADIKPLQRWKLI